MYFINYVVVLADARELPFDDDSFDCVFDKGLLDAILSGDYSA
jgi:ubiquinone/menaquinone biosynthesis C-methylase UbiE